MINTTNLFIFIQMEVIKYLFKKKQLIFTMLHILNNNKS